MVVSQKVLNDITKLTDRVLSSSDPLTSDDLKTALLHVRWLKSMGEIERAESWHKFYKGRFSKGGIEMPFLGADLRAVTSVETVKIAQASPNVGRPSTRPAYCTHPEVTECGRCPASWGRWWDCTGRPVGGSWGVSVVNPVNGEEVRIAKPADGKRVRGCYFQGGTVYAKGKAVKVARGVSVGETVKVLSTSSEVVGSGKARSKP
jgi:hypothetical protein